MLLRQTHWRCTVAEVAATISAIVGDTRQPLAAHVADGPRQSLATHVANGPRQPLPAHVADEQEVVNLLRAILQNEGGIADPSSLRTFKDGTKPYIRLAEMLPRGTLLQFLQSHSDVFDVLPRGPACKGFRFTLRPHSAAAHTAGVVPGSASTRSGTRSPVAVRGAPGSASASFCKQSFYGAAP